MLLDEVNISYWYNLSELTEVDDVDHSNITEEDKGSTLESDENKIMSKEILRIGSNFQCPQCDKLFSQNGLVHVHIRSVHEGVKYACNLCHYQGTERGDLTKHIQSKHKGVKYACNQCDRQYRTA